MGDKKEKTGNKKKLSPLKIVLIAVGAVFVLLIFIMFSGGDEDYYDEGNSVISNSVDEGIAMTSEPQKRETGSAESNETSEANGNDTSSETSETTNSETSSDSMDVSEPAYNDEGGSVAARTGHNTIYEEIADYWGMDPLGNPDPEIGEIYGAANFVAFPDVEVTPGDFFEGNYPPALKEFLDGLKEKGITSMEKATIDYGPCVFCSGTLEGYEEYGTVYMVVLADMGYPEISWMFEKYTDLPMYYGKPYITENFVKYMQNTWSIKDEPDGIMDFKTAYYVSINARSIYNSARSLFDDPDDYVYVFDADDNEDFYKTWYGAQVCRDTGNGLEVLYNVVVRPGEDGWELDHDINGGWTKIRDY